MDDDLTTWRQQLAKEMQAEEDTSPVVAVAPSEGVLDVQFDAGYGGSEGPDVLIWTEQRVYFPVVYDGAEWLGSAPRNPQPEGQCHLGGQ
jgi:hypothetical protein